MKKLLSLFGSIGLVASTGVTSVVSCDKAPKAIDMNDITFDTVYDDGNMQKFQIDLLDQLQAKVSSDVRQSDYTIYYYQSDGTEYTAGHLDQTFSSLDITTVVVKANDGSKVLKGSITIKIVSKDN